jgi:hypothetical protein
VFRSTFLAHERCQQGRWLADNSSGPCGEPISPARLTICFPTRKFLLLSETDGRDATRNGRDWSVAERQVFVTRFFLDQHRRMRDRALSDLAIDSKLRGCDVVKIKTGGLVLGRQIRSGAIVVQAKTGKPV